VCAVHGLINKSAQGFLTATYGTAVWEDIAHRAGLPPDGFEAMLSYPDDQTDALLDAACACLDRSEASLLEDTGTYLVTHSDVQPVRRLMRFGGPSFEDFILSLDELHDRARMAVPDLVLPVIEVSDAGGGHYLLSTRWQRRGAVALLSGVLNAMADDYGALVLLEPGAGSRAAQAGEGGDVIETLSVFLADRDFAEGNHFLLGGAAG
jgi:hypothetical protein